MSDGFSNSTVGGIGNLIRKFIQSVPFVSGSTGWRIGRDGTAEFNGATFRGGVVVSGNNGVLFYSSTPAHGNLVGSISPTGGVDAFGNAYPTGFMFTNGTLTFKASVETYLGTLLPDIRLSTGITSENTDFHIGSAAQGVAGTTRLILTQIVGPTNTTTKDVAFIELQSGSDNGTSAFANGKVLYDTNINGGGTEIQFIGWGSQGLFMGPCADLSTMDPTTGVNPANVAGNEVWHAANLNAGFQGLAGFNAPEYQFECMNGKRTRLGGVVQLTAAKAQGAVIFTLPAIYAPAVAKPFLTANSLSGGTGRIESFQVQTNGNVTLGQAGSNTNYVSFDGICFELD